VQAALLRGHATEDGVARLVRAAEARHAGAQAERAPPARRQGFSGGAGCGRIARKIGGRQEQHHRHHQRSTKSFRRHRSTGFRQQRRGRSMSQSHHLVRECVAVRDDTSAVRAFREVDQSRPCSFPPAA
jgi:hypothetical protein